MPIRSELKDKVTVCRIEGDVNIHNAPAIKKEFAAFIDQKPPWIIINFSGVNHIDSSGLGILVEILKHVKAYGGRLKLTNLSPKIKSMFEIIKFDKIFDIVSDEDGALASFK
jgi:anti-anti-sigma factor